ncbi:hypothetical protein F4821DRAFT_281290 [Hypoxylon rubiginosum]|uniref:Uncharacterized protein n=1 Tax=Hypoxylon rubiginosum TaxID=110542 RepID=A0ACC0DGB8_9PEZI|nr:hypothetical protein F4821DRAFT_281290 [Hypoxylon rubiginosum]
MSLHDQYGTASPRLSTSATVAVPALQHVLQAAPQQSADFRGATFARGNGLITTKALTKEEQIPLAESIRAEAPRYEDFVGESDSPVVFIADDYEDAIRHATHAADSLRTLNIPALAIFCDGSFNRNKQVGGIGICYKRTFGAETDWVDVSYGLHNVPGSCGAEVIALNRALWVAYYETLYWMGQFPDDANQQLPRVIIFSDCVPGMGQVCDAYNSQDQTADPVANGKAREVCAPLQKLIELGIHVEVRWVPSHISIEGNERADSLASLGAQYAARIPFDSEPDSSSSEPGSSSSEPDSSSSEPDSSSSKPALLPLLTFSQTGDPVKVSRVYGGRPFTDFMFWHRKEIRLMLIRLLVPQPEEWAWALTVDVSY